MIVLSLPLLNLRFVLNKKEHNQMKNTIALVLGIALLAGFLSTQSCKKDKCTAGTGGALTILATPQHHGDGVTPYAAYLKFDTREFPGASAAAYDLVVAADTTEDHVHLGNLKCGDYYIYMVGFDADHGDSVFGGIPFSTEQTSGEVNLTVPVTE
jgi:hypothetical protein